MMKKVEKIVVASILLVSIVFLVLFKINHKDKVNVVVKDVDQNILLTFNLYDDNYYEINGKVGKFHIEVKDGKCRAIDVDCPNQICVHTSWISEDNPLPIVCLPNGIVVQIDE